MDAAYNGVIFTSRNFRVSFRRGLWTQYIEALGECPEVFAPEFDLWDAGGHLLTACSYNDIHECIIEGLKTSKGWTEARLAQWELDFLRTNEEPESTGMSDLLYGAILHDYMVIRYADLIRYPTYFAALYVSRTAIIEGSSDFFKEQVTGWKSIAKNVRKVRRVLTCWVRSSPRNCCKLTEKSIVASFSLPGQPLRVFNRLSS